MHTSLICWWKKGNVFDLNVHAKKKVLGLQHIFFYLQKQDLLFYLNTCTINILNFLKHMPLQEG